MKDQQDRMHSDSGCGSSRATPHVVIDDASWAACDVDGRSGSPSLFRLVRDIA